MKNAEVRYLIWQNWNTGFAMKTNSSDSTHKVAVSMLNLALSRM